jgi:uncharacterized damage-inducible protein DinB
VAAARRRCRAAGGPRESNDGLGRGRKAIAMNTKDLDVILGFNQWADDTVLGALAGLDRERFTRRIETSHPSLRETLVHVLWAEELWLRRWHGESPQGDLDPSLFPDVAALRARWTGMQEGQRAFFAGLSDADLARTVSYLNPKGERWSYPLWQMMVHAFNHSTYHRGQLTTLFRQLGIPPVWTDFLVFIDHQAAG